MHRLTVRPLSTELPVSSAARREKGLLACGAMLLALLVTLLLAPGAQARESLALDATYDFGGQFGAGGPGMMDSDWDADSLYVVDPAENRILKFDISDPVNPVPEDFSALGSNELTEADGAPLVLAAGSQVAVDNSGGPQDGTIYLATDTATESRAYAFAASGEYLYTFAHNVNQEFSVTGTPQTGRGIAVANTGPRPGEIVRFGDSEARTSTYTPSGTPGAPPTVKVAQVPSQFPGGISGVGGLGFSNDGARIQVAIVGLFSTTFNFYDAGSLTKGGAYNFGSWGTPFDIAVGLDGTVLARKSSAGADFGRFRQVGKAVVFPPPASSGTELLERFGAGAQGSGTGMVETPAGYLYATDTASGQINILGPATAADAEMVETGFVDLTHAELRAQVNPLGLGIESCQFEWGTTTGYTSAPVACDVTPSGEVETTVAAPVEVVTGTTYHSRVVLVADNGTATYSDDLEWQAPFLPEAETLPAGPQQRSGTATLGGMVDANTTQTRFYIEYSTDPGLADSKSFPAARNADAGKAADPVRVFQVVDGLQPDTTYYFRLVAVTNAGSDAGEIESFRTFEAPSEPEPTNCTNAVFRTGPSATLPECRAYEQISPQDKNGGQVSQGATQSSPDGERVIYSSGAAFAGAQSLGVTTEYMAQPGVDGWSSQAMAPPTADAVQTTTYGLNFQRVTPDLSFAIGAGLNVGLPGAPGINTATYLWDTVSGENLGVAVGGGQSSGRAVGSGGLADDGRSGFAGGQVLPVDSGPQAPANSSNYFWWIRDGQDIEFKVASILPNGEAAIGGGSAYAISSSGEKLLWTSSDNQERPGSDEIYVRTRDGETLWASGAQGIAQPPVGKLNKPAAWSRDLRFVYFTSPQKLTADSTAATNRPDLYRFDTETEDLVDLTTEDASGAGVRAVMNLTPDGSRGFFVAIGNLDGATGEGQKLYAWNGNEIRLITDYPTAWLKGFGFFEGDSSGWEAQRKAHVSSDGRYFLFPFSGSTAGTRMDSVYETNGKETFYRYDWANDRIDCVSCDPTGGSTTADAYQVMPGGFRPNGAAQVVSIGSERRFMTDDGRVLFNTTQGLVPRDVNGRMDTYLWDGDLKLITDGTSDFHQWTEEASADFKDIYILSSKQLVPADNDGATDLYAASIGGGLASQQVRPAPAGPGCQGESCQGINPPRPSAPRVDSSAVRQTETVATEKSCTRQRRSVQRSNRAVKKRRAALKRTDKGTKARKKQHRRLKHAKKNQRRSKAALRRCNGGGS